MSDEYIKIVKDIINSDELNKILDEGRNKTSQIAKEKYELLKTKIGLGRCE